MRYVTALQKRPDSEHQARGAEIEETWCLFQSGLKVWSNLSGLVAGPRTLPCPSREEEDEEEGNCSSSGRTNPTPQGWHAVSSTSHCYI